MEMVDLMINPFKLNRNCNNCTSYGLFFVFFENIQKNATFLSFILFYSIFALLLADKIPLTLKVIMLSLVIYPRILSIFHIFFHTEQ